MDRRTALGVVLLVAGVALALLTGEGAWRVPVVAALTVPGAYLALGRHLGGNSAPHPPADPPVVVLDPVVTGCWTAVNSPTTRVPSHGTHGYAQTWAVDLLVDGDLTAPGGAFGRPDGFASFGAPVRSAVDGVVVTAADGQRDHRTRRGVLGTGYLVAESLVRVLGGMTRVTGNHVVVRAEPSPAPGTDVHVAVCHLRRGSVAVEPGQRVRAGDELGRCGNSGNTTQPHVHLQAMTGPDPRRSTGLPFRVRTAHGDVDLPPTGESLTF
ncbi:M23 family metallopeptidase [Klenkia sp. LSe6-5]|uniref:M23 family metallopeptidase n=1 Tax=Klenkia sesuvii TaxID=3103137 RepID=A0ABU8DP05_9ACTN